MKHYLFFLLALFSFQLRAIELEPARVIFEIETPVVSLIGYRPSIDELIELSPQAEAIFVEAFSTTYTEYYLASGSNQSIEQWLKLKNGLSLKEWLSNTFKGELEENLIGAKEFILIFNSEGSLLGFLSHSPLDEKGDIYLSQSSLEAGTRDQKVATMAFGKALQEGLIKKIFPGVKQVKLITRKINTRAKHLYLKAGFIMDETIDPSIYGESYDDRYVGFRLVIE